MASLAIIGTGQPRKFASTKFNNVGFWHFSEVADLANDVRSWGQSRPRNYERRLPKLTDAVEKVFYGYQTKFSKAADALRARRPEDPHRLIRKRPPAFVLAPEYLAAAAVPKNRLSRDFRCLSIFDFFDSIDPKETSSPSR